MPKRNKNDFADLCEIQEAFETLLSGHNTEVAKWESQIEQCGAEVETAAEDAAAAEAGVDVDRFLRLKKIQNDAETRLEMLEKHLDEVRDANLISMDEYHRFESAIVTVAEAADAASYDRISELADEIYHEAMNLYNTYLEAARLEKVLCDQIYPTGPTKTWHVKKNVRQSDGSLIEVESDHEKREPVDIPSSKMLYLASEMCRMLDGRKYKPLRNPCEPSHPFPHSVY